MKKLFRKFESSFWRNPAARIGIGGSAFLLILLTLAPLLPFSPDEQFPAEKLQAPSLRHPCGTDQYGRDVLARVAGGGRRSLGAAILVLSITLLVSLILGVAAGIKGGIFDQGLMRAVDVMLAFPPLILALAIVGVLGIGFENLIIALIVSSAAFYLRLARSLARLGRERQDVSTARLAGIGWLRIVAGHIAPGVFAQMLIAATLDLGGVIVGIAGLSFLGLGVQPPDAEWGAMLSESRLFFTTAPWLLLAPGAMIFLSVLSANLIGNALRDAADLR